MKEQRDWFADALKLGQRRGDCVVYLPGGFTIGLDADNSIGGCIHNADGSITLLEPLTRPAQPKEPK